MNWGISRGMRLLLVLALAAIPASALGVTFNLRADTTTKTMPDGRMVPMWGFALDSSFGAEDGTVTAPGPVLTVPVPDSTLRINLDNNLSVPVSIVIPGQTAEMTPVRNSDGRVVAFTHETPPGNAAPVVYEWTNVRPGSYIYHSGSHAAVQVQMGLYGAMKRNVDDWDQLAYEGIEYDNEVIVFYSAIDPEIHDAVATGNYGPGKAMTSTVDYLPQYFLVNGMPFDGTISPIAAGGVGDRTLIRMFNAGLRTHAMLLQGMRMSVVAEDGYKYRYAKDMYSVLMPSLKTKDAIITPSAAGTYPLYDRTLRLTNAELSPGGMLSYLQVSP